jgi:large subunit ribosomal protein LP2
MRIIAAYMLAVLGGNQNPDAAAVKKVLDSVASKYDEKRIDQLIAELKGKDLGQLIATGNAKLAALGPISAGGGSGGDAAPAKGDDKKKGGDDKKGGDKGGKDKGGDKKADKKKEEPKEEPPAEDDGGDMGLSLFD